LTEEHLGRRIARAMVTIFIFQVFWKFGGLIVKVLALNQFGGKQDKYILDAYTFAEGTVIFSLYVVFDKFIFPVFLPLFSEERELKGEDDAWRFANSFVNLLIPVLLATVVVLNFSMSEVVHFIARPWIAKHGDTANLAIQFCRCMLPALFFVALGSFTHALLNSYKRFGHAAAGIGMHRFVHALVFVVAFWVFGAPAVWAALAFTLAAPAKLLTHFAGLRGKLARYRFTVPYWRPIFKHAARWLVEFAVVLAAALLAAPLVGWRGVWPGQAGFAGLALLTALLFFSVRGLISWLLLRRLRERTLLQKVFLLAYPVLMGVAVARTRDLVQDSYATDLATGEFGAIKIAKSFGEAPMAIIPLALSMAMFPFLCDMFTKQNLKALSEVVSHAIKMIVLLFLPLTAVVVILRQPVIELLALKGVDPQLVDATALALALYSLGFIFYATEMVLMQTYFSLQNTWLPTLIGAVASFAQIGFLYVAFDVVRSQESAAGAWLRAHGLTPFIVVALAYPLSRGFKNLILCGILHLELRLFRARDALRFVAQAVLVSAATALVAWEWLWVGALAKWRLLQQLVAMGRPFVKLVKLKIATPDGVVEELVPTGMPTGLAVAIGRVVALGIPAVAVLIAFLGTLILLKKLRWPVAEFDIILKWLHETGWQKVKAKLKRGGKTQ